MNEGNTLSDRTDDPWNNGHSAEEIKQLLSHGK